MKLNLLSCNAQRPDRRAVSKCIEAHSIDMDGSLANELTDMLFEGDAVEIEINDKDTASVLRAMRKLDIDYEIIE